MEARPAVRVLDGEEYERDFTGVYWIIGGCVVTIGIMILMYLNHVWRVQGRVGSGFGGGGSSRIGRDSSNADAYGLEEPIGTGGSRGLTSFQAASREAASEYVYQSDGEEGNARYGVPGDAQVGRNENFGENSVREQELQDIART